MAKSKSNFKEELHPRGGQGKFANKDQSRGSSGQVFGVGDTPTFWMEFDSADDKIHLTTSLIGALENPIRVDALVNGKKRTYEVPQVLDPAEDPKDEVLSVEGRVDEITGWRIRKTTYVTGAVVSEMFRVTEEGYRDPDFSRYMIERGNLKKYVDISPIHKEVFVVRDEYKDNQFSVRVLGAEERTSLTVADGEDGLRIEEFYPRQDEVQSFGQADGEIAFNPPAKDEEDWENLLEELEDRGGWILEGGDFYIP